MPLWVSIPIAVACWLNTLMQIRMSLIYCGKVDSPATGFYKGQGSNPKLASIAMRGAFGTAVFGVLVLLVHWQQILTHIAAAWALFTVIDLVLLFLGTGMFSTDMSIFKPEARQGVMIGQATKALVLFGLKGVLFGAFFYFFGF